MERSLQEILILKLGPGTTCGPLCVFFSGLRHDGKKNQMFQKDIEKGDGEQSEKGGCQNEFVDIVLECSLAWNIQINHFL